MIGLTLAIAAAIIVIAVTRRNSGTALGILIISMLIWPEYLRVPIGPAAMSIPRLVAIALLFKYMAQGRHLRWRYRAIDTLVLLGWIWTVLATYLAGGSDDHMAQVIGRGFDTVLMYFVARTAVLSAEDAKGLYAPLALSAVFMCAMGVYETLTAASPYHQLVAYRGWTWIEKEGEFRYGLFRAQASTSVSIFFGMAMMLILAFMVSLRGYVRASALYKIFLACAFVAALSSMSSGPWIACFMIIALHFYANRTHLIKRSLFALFLLAIGLEVASNRHFYNLIDYLALDPHTAWYRTRLLEIAADRVGEYWLIGVGSNWPEHWAALLDGREHIDVVNHFLILALYGGLPAMVMYIATHVMAIKHATRAWRTDKSRDRRALLFGLSAALVALDASSMSVGLFGPPLLLSHILLGFLVTTSTEWQAEVLSTDVTPAENMTPKLSPWKNA